MKHVSTFAVIATILCGCASPLPPAVRTTRPEIIVVASPATFKVAGSFYKYLTVPSGKYVFDWEDDAKWCYRNTQFQLSSKSEKGFLAFDGYIFVSKKYDAIGVLSLLTAADLRQRGLGEFLVAMQPKRGDHYLMGEGLVPREVVAAMEFIGEVPIGLGGE